MGNGGMKKYKKEITVSEEFYELSKEELEKIKRKERVRGRAEMAHYISFCYSNYKLKTNIGGAVRFLQELFDFLETKQNGISNIYELDFCDYVDYIEEKLSEEDNIKD